MRGGQSKRESECWHEGENSECGKEAGRDLVRQVLRVGYKDLK